MKNVNDSDVDRSDLFQIHTYIQYFQQTQGRVLLGGLLYPLSVKIDDNNIATFHSNQLFGCDGKEQIPFIIDGIYCGDMEETNNQLDSNGISTLMEKRVQEMIGRIQNVLSNL